VHPDRPGEKLFARMISIRRQRSFISAAEHLFSICAVAASLIAGFCTADFPPAMPFSGPGQMRYVNPQHR